MPDNHGSYPAARQQLTLFLEAQGYKPHPSEVFCPAVDHCWVDVAALKGQDYWAFEYKSRTDSVRRGLEQCRDYASAFNYVVLVADRFRVTRSPYFSQFKHHGFGVWRHDGSKFYAILNPKRRTVFTDAKQVIVKQFWHMKRNDHTEPELSRWF
jgi:hypothetical protein